MYLPYLLCEGSTLMPPFRDWNKVFGNWFYSAAQPRLRITTRVFDEHTFFLSFTLQRCCTSDYSQVLVSSRSSSSALK